MADIYHPRYELTWIPVYMVWVTDVNSDVRALITHRDQICCEVLLYERGDKMEDILKLMSSSDEEKMVDSCSWMVIQTLFDDGQLC